MSDKIMIYKILGEGFVVGEEIKRTKENIWLRYPALLRMFPGQKQDEVFFKCIDLVPIFFDEFDILIQKFPLKRFLVYMESKLDKKFIPLYENYLKDLTKRMSNIEVVGAEALDHLPPIAPGRA